MDSIRTDDARSSATAPLQTFLTANYDPASGLAVAGALTSVVARWLSDLKPGYKVVTLRYLWGSAPYLHDGGVGICLDPVSIPAGDDLMSLLRRPQNEKIFGIAQILNYREKNPGTFLRPDAALSLQGLLLKSERDKIIDANRQFIWQISGTNRYVSIASMHIQGIGHDYYINDVPGGNDITALVAFLLALDDNPGKF
jgi:hypothetical protein